MSDYTWLVGWYATRRHAVTNERIRTGSVLAEIESACTARVFASDEKASRMSWRARRLQKEIPRCKNCLRLTGEAQTPAYDEPSLGPLAAYLDEWHVCIETPMDGDGVFRVSMFQHEDGGRRKEDIRSGKVEASTYADAIAAAVERLET